MGILSDLSDAIFGGSDSPPPAPDYAALARQQGIENRQAAIESAMLSNPNIISALGRRQITYARDPQTGNLVPTITDILNPQAQAALDAQQRVDFALSQLSEQNLGRLRDSLTQGFQYGGPNVQTGLNLSGIAKMPVNAGMTGQQAILSRLQPQIEQNREATRQNLANQGIAPGTEAWNNAMREQQQGENDMYQQAAQAGIQADMAANAQGFNQAVQSGQFANTAGQQDFERQLGLYNLPINQFSALRNSTQIQMPQFQGYTGQNVQAAPTLQAGQAKYESDLGRYNAQQSGKNSLTSGLFSLGGSALGGWLGRD